MALVVVNLSQAFAPPYPTNDMDAQTIAELQAVRQNLESQVDQLQVQEMRQAEPTSSATCVTATNPGPADSYISYTDPASSVSMKLPFNAAWGNGCAAVQTDSEGIHFGPGLEASIAILDPSKVPAFTTGVNRTVSGLKVYKDGQHTVAVGKTYAYSIYTKGWLTDAEINKLIQSLKVVK